MFGDLNQGSNSVNPYLHQSTRDLLGLMVPRLSAMGMLPDVPRAARSAAKHVAVLPEMPPVADMSFGPPAPRPAWVSNRFPSLVTVAK